MKQFKSFLTAIALLFAISFAAVQSQAGSISASTATLLFTTTNLTSSYQTLFASAAVLKAIKGITFTNQATSPVFVALGASGFEVDMLEVPASSGPTYYPFVASQAQRIAIHTSTGTISSGALQANIFYN